MAITLDPHLLADLSSGSGEPRGGSIWRDPHLQRQLLAAHLDDSTAAATRSPQAVRRTIDLLTAGLAPGASVLDLGCGPGRYAQQLADEGFDVTAVDFNTASIEYARQHARGRVRYLEADYTRDLPTEGQVRRFDVWEHCFAEDTIRAMLVEAGFVDVSPRRGVLAGHDPQSDDVTFVVATR